MESLFVFFLVAICCVFGANVAEVSERILNGDQIADIKEYEYVVALRCRGVHFCGGAIISSQYVLTSAECVRRCQLSELTVHSGSKFLNRAAMAHKPEHSMAHPNFNDRTKDFDVGLVRVPSAEHFSEFAPITITEEDLDTDSEVTALGWGVIAGEEEHSSVLRKVVLPIMARTACYDLYNGRPGINITVNMLCTSSEDAKGICDGDFGGPIVEGSTGNNLLVGVAVNASEFCGIKNYPNVFLKLQNDVRQWIRNNAQV